VDMAGQNVIVTGGSSGIGKATAKLFVRRGANVAIIARRQALLDTALAEVEVERTSDAQVFQAYSADLSDWEQASAAIEAVTADGRVPDVLINSAGTVRPGYFEELPIDVFYQTMDVDFFGTLHPCKLVAPMMMARRSGHIVNISSVAGFLGVFGYTAYSAAKFAIRGFSDVLRSELKPYGVCVSIVFPPDTNTPQLVEENKYKPLETRRISGTIRPMEPEQIAEAVVRAIGKDRYIIAPGFQTALSYALTNGLQGVARWYFDRIIAEARREKIDVKGRI
jgi:3-dehydrosphinganine reductase